MLVNSQNVWLHTIDTYCKVKISPVSYNSIYNNICLFDENEYDSNKFPKIV